MATWNVPLKVRVYTHRQFVTLQHSYLVNSETGGMSEVLGTISVVAQQTTLRATRALIELQTINEMNRRNPLFQDILLVMDRAVNPYNRSKIERRHYRIGYVKDGEPVPTLVSRGDETLPVGEVFPDLYQHSLVVIPVSQIDPEEESDCDESIAAVGSEADDGDDASSSIISRNSSAISAAASAKLSAPDDTDAPPATESHSNSTAPQEGAAHGEKKHTES